MQHLLLVLLRSLLSKHVRHAITRLSGIKVDEFGFTLVDFTKMTHKSDPFILAS